MRHHHRRTWDEGVGRGGERGRRDSSSVKEDAVEGKKELG